MEQVRLEGVRFSYAYIFQRTKERDPNKTGKYQVDLLWPKTAEHITQAVWGAVQKLYAEASQDPKLQGAIQRQQFKTDVIKDGDRAKWGKPDQSTYAGYYYIVAKSDDPVQVIDQYGKLLTTDAEFFSGCFGNAGIGLRTYAPSDKVPQSGYGITVKLLALQRTGGNESDRLAGNATVEAAQFFNVQPAPMPGMQQPGQPYGQPVYQGQGANVQAPIQYQQPAQQAPAAGAPYGNPAPQTQFGPPAQPVGQPAPAAQGFPGAPQQANPFPQTGLPQQPVAQPGFQTGQPAQFPPAQAQQPAGPHQPTPAFGAQQGFDPYAGQR
ncbi:MAG TPA: ssDNA-binding protein [Dyadobacter sp.]|nr:ssDNA-binding protein [Dyadobacter sp.]